MTLFTDVDHHLILNILIITKMTTTNNISLQPSKIDADQRLDPRIKKALARIPKSAPLPNVKSREELLSQEYSEQGMAANAYQNKMYDAMDNEELAPSAGLSIRTETFISKPDGNTIKIQYIRPDTNEVLPCIYYIHGGRMEFSSCFLGNYKTWGRMIAHTGLAVAMVDFRNSVHPDSSPDVGPFPAGLNDCISGLQWVHDNASSLGIDPTRIVVAGESGGANLSFAVAMKLKKEGNLALIKGIYALCPFIAGEWPLPQNPSSTENEGIFITVQNNRSTMAYGIDAFNEKNPLAWPGFAQTSDVEGFPPVVISVNECDPLRDEGIGFYHLLQSSGVAVRCRQLMGACHGIEILPVICPDLALSSASDIASFVSWVAKSVKS
jgi:acetyl esterase/lipase